MINLHVFGHIISISRAIIPASQRPRWERGYTPAHRPFVQLVAGIGDPRRGRCKTAYIVRLER